MRFTKMQGAGNDYVYVNCFDQPVPEDVAALSRAMSDRHFGIGADGLILICPSQRADAQMRMYNADGSEGGMCGNGIRCVAKYVYDHGLARKPTLQIETNRGVLALDVELNGSQRVARVRVNMGEPILQADQIPTTLPGNPPQDVSVRVRRESAAGEELGIHREFSVTCVSMGNPHAVTFVDALTDDLVLAWGPALERAAEFPDRVNAEFVEVLSESQIRLRVWERGSGETLACGTGACAAVVAAALSGRTGRQVQVQLPGGALDIDWDASGAVFMTGPAEEVFHGVWDRTPHS